MNNEKYPADFIGPLGHHPEPNAPMTIDDVARLAEDYNGKHQRACVEIGRLRRSLYAIHNRAVGAEPRTFDAMIRDMDWIVSECRMVLDMNHGE